MLWVFCLCFFTECSLLPHTKTSMPSRCLRHVRASCIGNFGSTPRRDAMARGLYKISPQQLGFKHHSFQSSMNVLATLLKSLENLRLITCLINVLITHFQCGTGHVATTMAEQQKMQYVKSAALPRPNELETKSLTEL